MDYNEIISKGKQVIKSRIDGDFEGFDDENLFPLYNGQYWIQKITNIGTIIHIWPM